MIFTCRNQNFELRFYRFAFFFLIVTLPEWTANVTTFVLTVNGKIIVKSFSYPVQNSCVILKHKSRRVNDEDKMRVLF